MGVNREKESKLPWGNQSKYTIFKRACKLNIKGRLAPSWAATRPPSLTTNPKGWKHCTKGSRYHQGDGNFANFQRDKVSLRTSSYHHQREIARLSRTSHIITKIRQPTKRQKSQITLRGVQITQYRTTQTKNTNLLWAHPIWTTLH